MLNIQYKEGSIWGCPSTPWFYLVIFIYVGSSIFSIHFQVMRYHKHICTSPPSLPSVSILLSLFSPPNLVPSLPSLCFSSHLPSSIFPSIFTLTPPPLPPTPLSPSISPPFPPSTLGSLSLSLRRALMNCLPLPVNSTDNPGEAVKDHRSALQTGPQATAHEQHPNNKPLHLALGIHVCMYMHVCVHACLWAW